MYFKIQEFFSWARDSKTYKGKKYLYEKEFTFKHYWDYHKKSNSGYYLGEADSHTRGMIAYQDGKEIGRYGRFDNVLMDVEPKVIHD